VNGLIIGLLGALVATNQAATVSNLVTQTTGLSVRIPDPNDPVEQEYLRLLEQDDAAQVEADRWIQENQSFKDKGAGLPAATLALKIEQRFEPVRKAYEEFLQRHPNHARARIAFGGFLDDMGREFEARDQWEKARQIDPRNPAPLNNLANFYGHNGPVTNAFRLYEQAIGLNPLEPLYHQNLATLVFLYRIDAMDYYRLNEQQVFDRALSLYRQALKLAPTSFVLANDLAQTYYGVRPPRHLEALAAWQEALKLAKDDLQREGVYVHLARTELALGRFADARRHLDQVTHDVYRVLKERLMRNLREREEQARTAPQSGTVTNSR